MPHSIDSIATFEPTHFRFDPQPGPATLSGDAHRKAGVPFERECGCSHLIGPGSGILVISKSFPVNIELPGFLEALKVTATSPVALIGDLALLAALVNIVTANRKLRNTKPRKCNSNNFPFLISGRRIRQAGPDIFFG